MSKLGLKNILIVAIILIFAFTSFRHFFENPENQRRGFIARQKFSGIIQQKYADSTLANQQTIVVNGMKNYIDNEFAKKLSIGDSVSKILYELNATIYKNDGRIIEFDLLNKKPKNNTSKK